MKLDKNGVCGWEYAQAQAEVHQFNQIKVWIYNVKKNRSSDATFNVNEFNFKFVVFFILFGNLLKIICVSFSQKKK